MFALIDQKRLNAANTSLIDASSPSPIEMVQELKDLDNYMSLNQIVEEQLASVLENGEAVKRTYKIKYEFGSRAQDESV